LQTVIENLVPQVDPTYVPFGFYRDLTKVLKSENFYPTFISGLSGNGKTTMVEQACAKLKRECIRVNISIETDEDDLIGGNTLIDGNVVYREGPVLTAMKRGAVLILD
jgi:midasin (ATPase involved in ribosome maturation)